MMQRSCFIACYGYIYFESTQLPSVGIDFSSCWRIIKKMILRLPHGALETHHGAFLSSISQIGFASENSDPVLRYISTPGTLHNLHKVPCFVKDLSAFKRHQFFRCGSDSKFDPQTASNNNPPESLTTFYYNWLLTGRVKLGRRCWTKIPRRLTIWHRRSMLNSFH